MRIKLGPDDTRDSSRSYLDSADDIVGLPAHELLRITRASERRGSWLTDRLEERTPDLLYRLYALASQI